MNNTINIILSLLVLALITWVVVKPSSTTLSPSPSPSPLLNTTKETPMPSSSSKQYTAAKQVTQSGKTYYATLKTTAGEIEIILSNATPVTTNNFVFLAQEKFYDGVIFHRTIPNFMIQGGDPTGTGSGGPGYQFPDEQFTGEYKKGVVAMANAGPNTNGSQFFIMHADYPLPPNYIIFGMVTKGIETVNKIATAPTVQDGQENSRPVSPVKIESIAILEK